LNTEIDANIEFIKTMDKSFRMKSPDWLLDRINNGANTTIIDLRGEKAFTNSRITGSINIPLNELPERYGLLPDDRSATIVCACNGSVQSAYAIMFLFSWGYSNVYNLSGGFSSWEKKEYPVS